MRFIEEFVQKVRETEDSFNLTKEVVLDRDGVSTPQNFHFMQEKLGNTEQVKFAREIGPSGGIPAENIQKITFIGEILYNRDQVTIDRNI